MAFFMLCLFLLFCIIFFFHFNVVVYHRLDPLFLCKETKADKSLSYSILHEEGTIRLPPVCGAIFFFFLS